MEMGGQTTWRCPGPRPVLEGFLKALLLERDAGKAVFFLTADIYSAGPDGQAARDREEFRKLAQEHIKEVPEALPYRILDYREKPETEDCRTCLCRIRNPGQEGRPPAVLSAFFRKERGSWRISSLHIAGMALPAREEQEGTGNKKTEGKDKYG